MKRSYILLVALLAIGYVRAFSQAEPCGTPDPGRAALSDISFALRAHATTNKVTETVKVIPIAFHVIRSFDGFPPDPTNISDAQIATQMQVLNDDFRGRSTGIDTEIEFCNAGVNRLLFPQFATVDQLGSAIALKDSIQVNPDSFLNVWIVNGLTNGGAALEAFSTYPKDLATHPELDGIVIDYSYFGTFPNSPSHRDGGRDLVHEIGHWLSLLHVFQGGCDDNSTCETQGDCCCDTPPQKERLYDCQTLKNSCKDDQPDKNDPVRNHMGYSNDQCKWEFTACQKARMQLCLDSIRRTAWFPLGSDCPRFKKAVDRNAVRDIQIAVYPNPFSNETSINVTVTGKETPVTVTILDTQGRQVATLLDYKVLPVGEHEYRFDAPYPGIYLARVASPWATKTIKLVRLAK
jgi:Pregnancy-associated plasma protein-A